MGRGRGRLNHNACTPSAPGDGWEEGGGGGRREDPRHAPALTPVPTPAPAPTPPAHLPATPAPPHPGCGETPIGARGLARSQHHTTPHGPPQHGPPRHNTTRRVLRGMQVDTPRACLPFPSGPGPPARFLPPPLPPPPPRPRPRGRGRGRAPHPRLWPGTRLWGCWGGGDRRVGAVGVWARPAPAPPGNDAPGRHHGGGGNGGGWKGRGRRKGGVDPNTPDPRK